MGRSNLLIKRNLVLLLAVLVCCICFGVGKSTDFVSAEGEATPIYQNDFTGATSASEWEIYNNLGTVTYKDDAMFLENKSGTAILLFNQNLGTDNYILEFDIAFTYSLNNTRWGGILFRFNDGSYYQTMVRVSGGTNIDLFTKPSTWGSQTATSVAVKAQGQSYRIKTVVFESNITFYIDDVYLGTREMGEGFSSGKIGFTCNSATVKIDNVTITKALEAGKIPRATVADIYIPQTQLSNPPVVVANIQSAADYQKLSQAKKPAVAIYSIDDSLNILGENDVVIATVDAMVETHSEKIIPAFYIDSASEADALSDYIADNMLYDSFVMADSNKAALVKSVRDKSPYIRGIIRFSNKISTTQDVYNILSVVNSNSASVALIDKSISEENVRKLQLRYINTWLPTSDVVSIYTAITSGANGIVCADAVSVYDIYQTFDHKSITRTPFFIGHRGLKSLYSENTLNGFKLAYAMGADAIELDIFLSSDGEMVIYHDFTLDALTNGTGNIEDKTLAQLKALTVTAHPNYQEKIPTLREVYEYFHDKDFVLNVEIKSGNEAIIPKLAALTREYNMTHKIYVSSFNASQIALARKAMPEVSALIATSFKIENTTESIEYVLKTFSPTSSNLESQWDMIKGVPNYAYFMSARGFLSMPWTINNDADIIKAYYDINLDAVLTDFLQKADVFAGKLSVDNILVDSGEQFEVVANIVGQDTEVTPVLVKISGDNVTATGGKYTISGTGIFIAYYDYEVDLNGTKATYRIYSSPFAITTDEDFVFPVVEADEEPDDEEPDDEEPDDEEPDDEEPDDEEPDDEEPDDEEPDDEEPDDEEPNEEDKDKKGGCKSSTEIFTVMSALGFAMVFKIKKFVI